MTGARPARLLAAALLAAPLLLAATDAAAQTAGLTVVQTSGSTTVREGSVGSPGTTDTFTVRLATNPVSTSVEVAVAVKSADTGECQVSVGGSTYGNSGTLTFVPTPGNDAGDQTSFWNATQTVTVRSGEVDGDETCEVDLTSSVTTTLGGTDYVGLTDTVSVTVTDNDVRLSVSPMSISENGGTATVTASMLSDAAAEVTITVSAAPVSPAVASDYALSPNTTLRIASGARDSTGSVTITARDNSVNALDKEVTVSATVSTGYDLNPASVPLTIADDDGPPPPPPEPEPMAPTGPTALMLTLTPALISENGETSTVTATLAAAAASLVTLTVSAAPGTNAAAGDFAQTGTTLTIAAGATSSTGAVTITAADDDIDGPDKRVTVSATADGPARAPAPVALTIADDDETPQVALALTPAMIGEGGTATVTATLERASSEATTITVSASGEDFEQSGTTLTVAAGERTSTGRVTITAVNAGDREVIVSGRAANAHGIVPPANAVLSIRGGADAVTKVLLPEAARAMADSRASAVRRRLQSADAGAAAEMALLPALLAERGPALRKDGLDWKTALAGSSFALPLNAAGGEAGRGVAVWGSGDYRDLDGEARGVSWDGEVASAHLGLDRQLANGMRVGLAASWSEAKFDYRDRNQEGEWELEMTSAQPYLGWTAGNGIELWASAGAGSGELEIETAGGRREKSDADMWLAAAGARKPLRETESGLQVSLRGEALYSSFEVDGNGRRIPAYTADASRLRLALEARRDRALASGARLSPRFELGVRHDGGDGETGAGVELGGGAEYAKGRLTASAGARALAANSDYDEWGADLALAYAPGADGRGFSFRLAPSWGAVQSGAQELWEQGASGLSGTADEPDPGGRLAAELGYGLKSPWSRGLLRLTLGGEAGEDAGAACRLAGAVALDAAASLGLELEMRDPKSGGAERSLMVTGELRF